MMIRKSSRTRMLGWGAGALLVLSGAAWAKPFISAKGYSVSPPVKWKVNTSGMMGSDVIFIAPPSRGASASLNVVVTQAPGETLEGGRAQINKMLPQMFNGYKRVAQGYTTLGGLRALSTTSTYLIGTPPRRLRMKQVVALRKGRAYTFTAAALDNVYARYNTAFTQSLKTVRWR